MRDLRGDLFEIVRRCVILLFCWARNAKSAELGLGKLDISLN